MADQDTKAEKEKEMTYHIDRLVGEAGDFFPETPSHVVAAALGAVKGNKVNFTRAEGQRAIQNFLDREVEMSYGTFTGVPGEGA